MSSINIEDLTLKQLKEIAAMFPNVTAQPASVPHAQIGKYVIIRSYASGVWCANLDSYDPHTRHAVLSNARRLWSWSGAFTLSTVSLFGVVGAKMPAPVDGVTVAQVEEIIPTTGRAERNLREWPVHNG